MSPEQKLARARSKRRLQYLKELQKRPNLSPEGQKKLPGLIEMQERVLRRRERVYLKDLKLTHDHVQRHTCPDIPRYHSDSWEPCRFDRATPRLQGRWRGTARNSQIPAKS